MCRRTYHSRADRLGLVAGLLVFLSFAMLVQGRSFPVGRVSVNRERGKSETGLEGAKSRWNPGGGQGKKLGMLRRLILGPVVAGESNYYLDLWGAHELADFARAQGLTNNHALFVDSHGGRGSGEYCFWARDGFRVEGVEGVPFTIGDLASVLGTEAVAGVHNIVIAGCNEEGGFESSTVRKYFVNATNVIYMAPGFSSYKPLLHEALSVHSQDVRTFYGVLKRGEANRWVCRVATSREEGMDPLGYFIADSFRSRSSRPYLRRKAGRELLDPGVVPVGLGVIAESHFRRAEVNEGSDEAAGRSSYP